MAANAVPSSRVTPLNTAPVREEGDFVLYWMVAFRRARWNFSLQRAVEWCRELRKPLVVLEALRCDYPWANDRLHRFILDGMADNAVALRKKPVLHYPYVEPRRGAGKELLAALSERSAVVVTDDYPAFFIPRMVQAAAGKVSTRMEKVDSNGLLPLRAADRVFQRALSFRQFLAKNLPFHLPEAPQADPLRQSGLPRPRALPAKILRRWPPAPATLLAGAPAALARLPLDHTVLPAPIRGGSRAAEAAWRGFLRKGLPRYAEERNQPEAEATSRLSPYLHFGHLSVHQMLAELMAVERRSGSKRPAGGTGKLFAGVSPGAEAFLDQLVTWRELSFNFSSKRDDYDRYESLPAWARKTLEEHRRDPRPALYSLKDLEEARTHDPIWNAAMRQLRREGWFHNHLRMLWGKKILEWTPSPRKALAAMIQLMNKHSLDGRDPCSYAGYSWILGRYDRPWGPERPIFGKVRYMTSASLARKVRIRGYLERYGPDGAAGSPEKY